MKKTTISLIGILVLIIGTMSFAGCAQTPNYDHLYGELTITNAPAGFSFSAFVYSSSVLPNSKDEYSSMTTGALSAGPGATPISLSWPSGTTSGNFLVTLRTGTTTKMTIANFNSNGKTTVNWDTMDPIP